MRASPNTYPLAGFHPEDMRRDAGAYSATAGLLSPRRPARASSESLAALMDLTVRGLPFGTRVRRFVSRAILWLHAPPHRWSFAIDLEPLKAGSGSPPLLALHRYRSARASWISTPNRASFQAPAPATSGCWIQTSRHGSGASIMAQPALPGISPIAVNTRAPRA